MKELYIFTAANNSAKIRLNVLPWMERQMMVFIEFAYYSVWPVMVKENLTMLEGWQNSLYIDKWKHWMKFLISPIVNTF